MELMAKIKPETILDVGCGNGKWGMLFHDVCETLAGNPDSLHVYGIEPSPYVRGYHKFFYNIIFEMTVQEYLQGYPDRYDVIWCGDILEHLAPEDVMYVTYSLIKRCNRAFIAAVPIGEWKQGAVGGNEYEVHRNEWTLSQVQNIADDWKVYKWKDREYCVFVKWISGKKWALT
jgi:SAM-dependent methyltransferase